ncbi:MAG: hypothetical protein E6Q97_36040 [Desulfurellales bacterium]|nr:MAG: hypothetical protein E6Q97_36040 [Desulfurellales bacterium]
MTAKSYPIRERQTRWKTSDGRFFDDRDTAVFEQKVIVLGIALSEAARAHGESFAVDFCEDLARDLLRNQRGIIIALVPVKEGA